MRKVWIITGGGRGLGRDIVDAALAAGHRVLATARDAQALETLAQQHKGSLLPFSLDVTAAQRAVNAAVDRFGQIDVLINNAGYGHFLHFSGQMRELSELPQPCSVGSRLATPQARLRTKMGATSWWGCLRY